MFICLTAEMSDVISFCGRVVAILDVKAQTAYHAAPRYYDVISTAALINLKYFQKDICK